MADLRNLLDEVEDRDNVGFNALAEDGQEFQSDINDTEGHDEDDLNDVRHVAALPPALAEAERVRSSVPRGEDDQEIIDTHHDDPYGEDTYGDTRDINIDIPADPEYELLKSLWAQELMCPELLPHDIETITLHLELLQGQEETIGELQDAAVAVGGGAADPMLSHLAAGIYKMEADRVRFLLADLTRTRLAKLENHALHNRELVDRMSEDEVSITTLDALISLRHDKILVYPRGLSLS